MFMTPNLTHNEIFVVGACHAVDVGTLRTVLTEHLTTQHKFHICTHHHMEEVHLGRRGREADLQTVANKEGTLPPVLIMV